MSNENEHRTTEQRASEQQCENPEHWRIYAEGMPDENCVYCQIDRLARENAQLRQWYSEVVCSLAPEKLVGLPESISLCEHRNVALRPHGMVCLDCGTIDNLGVDNASGLG